MTYREAIEDNIPFKKGECGLDWYYPPCHVCGASVPSWGYIRGTKYTCPDCKRLLAELATKDNNESKKAVRLNEAIKRISKVADIKDYERARKCVASQLYHKGWYQSTEEMMVAMELIRQNVKAYHQAKVIDYRVDFLLPEHKVVLEVDGEIYHAKRKDELRDERIRLVLGDDWQVIRIKTQYINKDVTKLLPAIKEILKFRKSS